MNYSFAFAVTASQLRQSKAKASVFDAKAKHDYFERHVRLDNAC